MRELFTHNLQGHLNFGTLLIQPPLLETAIMRFRLPDFGYLISVNNLSLALLIKARFVRSFVPWLVIVLLSHDRLPSLPRDWIEGFSLHCIVRGFPPLYCQGISPAVLSGDFPLFYFKGISPVLF